MTDGINKKILDIIQSDAQMPNAEIARRVRMAPSAVLECLRKLETWGVIQRHETRLSPQAFGRGWVAFVYVQVDDWVGEVKGGARRAEIPEV